MVCLKADLLEHFTICVAPQCTLLPSEGENGKKFLVSIISSTWIILKRFFPEMLCLAESSEEQKSENKNPVESKNNDGEGEITQMKIKINFHGVILVVPANGARDRAKGGRHIRARCQNTRHGARCRRYLLSREEKMNNDEKFAHSNDFASSCMREKRCWTYFQFTQARISLCFSSHAHFVDKFTTMLSFKELYLDIGVFYLIL